MFIDDHFILLFGQMSSSDDEGRGGANDEANTLPKSVHGEHSDFSVWSRHCLAGGISAIVSKTVSAPLDRIKIHLQVTNDGGFRTAVRHVYGNQGVWGFWRGNGLNVLKSCPEFAVRFSVYDSAKRQLRAFHGNDGRPNSGDRFVAGAVAGVCSHIFLYPLEVVKTRLTVGNYKGVADVLAKTYNREGASAFFRGFWFSMASIFLYTGIDMMTYEHVKHWQLDHADKAPPWLPVRQWTVNLVSALCSSTAGVSLCYPLSTFITRIQVNNVLPILVDDQTTTTATRIYKWKRHVFSTNIRILYRGLSSSLAKMLPSTSITYVVYEGLCELFNVQMT